MLRATARARPGGYGKPMGNKVQKPARRGGPIAATRRCMARYAQFSGRASRREFWWFWLVCVTGLWVALILDSVLLAGKLQDDSATIAQDVPVFLPVTCAFALTVALPQLAVGWRRMHDTGRSGLYLIYPLIVLTGIGSFASFLGATTSVLSGDLAALVSDFGDLVLGLAILVLGLSPLLVVWWLARPGQPGTSRHGPPPGF